MHRSLLPWTRQFLERTTVTESFQPELLQKTIKLIEKIEKQNFKRLAS